MKRHGLRPQGIKRRMRHKNSPQRRLGTNKMKVKSISKLIKECDVAFSKIVRNTGAKKTQYGLMNRCYTCDNAFEVKRLHAGHYLSRIFKAARWDFDNARPQCFACNIYRKGDAVRFRMNLINELGEARVLAVEALRDAPINLTRQFLEETLSTLQKCNIR